MIDVYFEKTENTLQYFQSIIKSYSITKEIYNEKQGFIKGKIIFINNSQLNFLEVKNTDITGKVKYRYHYMGRDNILIFRYDNAYHHPEIDSFPHHKHQKDKITGSKEPNIYDILLEIQKTIHKK
jgi:hypothetical protein